VICKLESIQATAGGMPVLILKEGTRAKGREAQRNNFVAAKLIAEMVKHVWSTRHG
jgi:hypothetical protein